MNSDDEFDELYGYSYQFKCPRCQQKTKAHDYNKIKDCGFAPVGCVVLLSVSIVYAKTVMIINTVLVTMIFLVMWNYISRMKPQHLNAMQKQKIV